MQKILGMEGNRSKYARVESTVFLFRKATNLKLASSVANIKLLV